MVSRTILAKHRDYQLAFQEDCELFLQRYLLHSTYNFGPFAQIWTEIKFGLIFVAKYKDYEVGHFTHMLLHCAKKYLILAKCRYIQTGGLYLLYAIYNKQPIKDLIKIRILLNELQIIQEYLEFMRKEGCIEPIFIFNSLLKALAFDFVATQHEVYLGTKYTAQVELNDDIFPMVGTNIPVEVAKETSDALKNICSIDTEMMKKLEAYKRNHKEVLIDYDSSNQKELVEALLTDPFHEDETNDGNEFVSPSASTSQMVISDKRRSIIDKAFTSDSRSKFIKQLSGEEKLKKIHSS